MIVNLDVKSLEIVVAGWLSKDKVLIEELNRKVDIHSVNQEAFKLPDRVIAKILVFRILYGGNEYSFVHDPDFACVSTSLKYWKKVIDRFYEKYSGIAQWHANIIREVGRTGTLTTPLGRSYTWDLHKYGSYKIPETEVKNYPVQGTGADLVAMARCSLRRRWKNIDGLLISTVHDSIVADVKDHHVSRVVDLFDAVFKDLPTNVSRIFNVEFDLETRVEIQIGKDMYNLEEVG